MLYSEIVYAMEECKELDEIRTNIICKKEEVKNKDLWQSLDLLVKQHKINWFWVKGHADNEMNNRADELARMEVYK